MAEEDLIRVEDAFLAAVERCKKIGFDFIDIHGAHGYLLHEFVSPLSNTRTDQYGGSLENRIRYPLRITSSIRKAWQKPLFYRLSATDWAEGPEKDENGEWRQWGLEQSKILVGEIEKLGVDLVDVSTGGNWEKQSIPIGPGYQVPFAEALKKAHPKLVYSAVGLITSPKQAESYLQDGKTDVIFIAREFLRNPHWAMYAAQELGVAIKPANEYERAWMDVLAPKPAAEN
ncbi:hypothetical protein EW026_g322 [Hermanssonia centrifuga]|uniref:NADH:flavin oxidoreductase/NADH oxidase N-terminal domain-containing protein n=1 Tax=Hermanssonia centrifuga TaxID=98765 RepID=A0A4S4KWS0_9APHY|nr:hypothetical protein EW026_g322 [Hermanssonia centrifuga]